MEKFKGALPSLCLSLALALLFGRGMIPHGKGASFSPVMAAPGDGAITIHYHERPPYYMTGSLGVYGLCVDPVKRAFDTANIPCRWEKTPANRQLDILKENRSRACFIGWFKNSEREKFAGYSLPIYQDKPFIALARADNHQLMSDFTLEEILVNPDLVLLRKNGYSYGSFVDTLMINAPRQKMTSAENIGMLKILHSGGADYFFISEEEATHLIDTSGLIKENFKYIRFTNMPGGNKRYLLFSQQVESQVIEKINAAIINEDVHGL